MDSTDCFLEILSAYQSSDSGCQVSLLEYCHRFGVDYYKFLGWYRHYKCQLTNPTSPSGMQLTPIHVNGSPSGHSRCTLSPKSVKSDNFEIVSFRLKLFSSFWARTGGTSKSFIMIQGDTCFIGRSWTKTVSSCLFSARPVIVMKSVGRNSWFCSRVLSAKNYS